MDLPGNKKSKKPSSSLNSPDIGVIFNSMDDIPPEKLEAIQKSMSELTLDEYINSFPPDKLEEIKDFIEQDGGNFRDEMEKTLDQIKEAVAAATSSSTENESDKTDDTLGIEKLVGLTKSDDDIEPDDEEDDTEDDSLDFGDDDESEEDEDEDECEEDEEEEEEEDVDTSNLSISELSKFLQKKNADKAISTLSNLVDQQQKVQSIIKNQYPNGDISVLFDPDNIGQIVCDVKDDFYIEFKKKYPEEDIKVSSLLPLAGYGADAVDFTAIDSFHIVDFNDKYILLKGKPKKPNYVGFYIAMIRYDGEYIVVVPKFNNNYDINGSLFSSVRYPDLFNEDNEFILDNINNVEASLDLLLVTRKKVILSPNQFGIITQASPKVKNPSEFLFVGTIQSFDTPEAICFKKDAELDESIQSFRFYFRFNTVYRPEFLQKVSEIAFKMDMKNSLLFANKELKFAGSRIYIDIDLPDIDQF